jgi:hypothetical protein
MTLRNAVRAAIARGCPRSAISVEDWALTYNRSEDDVRAEWASALASVPPNVIEEIGEGK